MSGEGDLTVKEPKFPIPTSAFEAFDKPEVYIVLLWTETVTVTLEEP